MPEADVSVAVVPTAVVPTAPAAPTIPQAIQDDINNLGQKIASMRSVIQEVRDARKKLHDDSDLWVKNNIAHALKAVEQAQTEVKQDSV